MLFHCFEMRNVALQCFVRVFRRRKHKKKMKKHNETTNTLTLDDKMISRDDVNGSMEEQFQLNSNNY